MAREAVAYIDTFNTQDLANTTWAFATLGLSDVQLLLALARDIAILAWAFAPAGQLDAEQFTVLGRATEEHMDDFNVQELANTAWAFAMLDRLIASLFMVREGAAWE